MATIREKLIHAYIRKKAALHKTPVGRYQIRVARSLDDYQQAYALVHAAYVMLGIESVRCDHLHIKPQHMLPEATVFLAFKGETLVGTVSTFVDSPAGLPIEKDYPDLLKNLRATGRKLSEIGAFAIREQHQGNGVAQLLQLACSGWLLQVEKADDVVMGVHPHAAIFYEAIFACRKIESSKGHSSLKAPVQLLVSDLRHSTLQMQCWFNKPMSNGISYGDAFADFDHPDVDVPKNLDGFDVARWKMSGDTFRDLFIEHTPRYQKADGRVRERINYWRTENTLAELPV